MNKVLLESFEGDVKITLEQDGDKKEVVFTVDAKNGSGKNYYFITESEMLQLVDAYLATFDDDPSADKSLLNEALHKLRPFELGDDPYKWGVADTLDRVRELLIQHGIKDL